MGGQSMRLITVAGERAALAAPMRKPAVESGLCRSICSATVTASSYRPKKK